MADIKYTYTGMTDIDTEDGTVTVAAFMGSDGRAYILKSMMGSLWRLRTDITEYTGILNNAIIYQLGIPASQYYYRGRHLGTSSPYYIRSSDKYTEITIDGTTYKYQRIYTNSWYTTGGVQYQELSNYNPCFSPPMQDVRYAEFSTVATRSTSETVDPEDIVASVEAIEALQEYGFNYIYLSGTTFNIANMSYVSPYSMTIDWSTGTGTYSTNSGTYSFTLGTPVDTYDMRSYGSFNILYGAPAPDDDLYDLYAEMLGGEVDGDKTYPQCEASFIAAITTHLGGGEFELLPLTKVTFTGIGQDTTYELDAPTESYGLLGIVDDQVTIKLDGNKTVSLTYDQAVGDVELSVSGSTIIVKATAVTPQTGITAYLYDCECDPRYVDKSNYLNAQAVMTGAFVSPYDQMNPTIRLDLSRVTNSDGKQVAVSDFNYIKIVDEESSDIRYYYTTNRTYIGANLWDIALEEDVLMTFKDQIDGMTAMIDRWEGSDNDKIPDGLVPIGSGQELTTREMTVVNDIFNLDNAAPSFVLNAYNLTAVQEE